MGRNRAVRQCESQEQMASQCASFRTSVHNPQQLHLAHLLSSKRSLAANVGMKIQSRVSIKTRRNPIQEGSCWNHASCTMSASTVKSRFFNLFASWLDRTERERRATRASTPCRRDIITVQAPLLGRPLPHLFGCVKVLSEHPRQHTDNKFRRSVDKFSEIQN